MVYFPNNNCARLSIITINLNNKEGFQKTIESVMRQTFTAFEFIVIDGASIDGSIDLIKAYADKITYWISEPDSGIFNAMNKGIKQATGEYCLFLNSGDHLYNEHVLENALSLNFKEDIVYGDQYIEKNDKLVRSLFLTPEYITFRSFINSTIPHQCTFIKRKLFDLIGLYNENNRIVSDWEWNALALFKYNCSLKKINLPISVYNTNGISSNQDIINEHQKEKKEALLKHFSLIMKDLDAIERYENSLSFKLIKILKRIIKK